MNGDSPLPACPLCHSETSKPLYSLGEFDLFRCEVCKGGYVSPMPPTSSIATIYGHEYGEEYLGGVMHEESFAELRFRSLVASLQAEYPELLRAPRKRVLDVGCGGGRFLSLLRDSGWDTQGVEVSPGLARYARESLGLTVHMGDFAAADLPPGHFDLVSMFHVIEHMVDPLAALNKVRGLLKEGGALFIETPNWESVGALVRGPRWSHYIPPEHLVYLGPRSITRLGAACGFSTRMCRTTTPPVLASVQVLPMPIRWIGRAVYRLASIAGFGPALQYMGVKA